MAMTEDAATLRRLDALIWAIVIIVVVLVLVAPFVSDFAIAWTTFVAPLGLCLALTSGAAFYRRWRNDPRLASSLECTAQVIAFAAVGAPLSYLAAAAGAAIPLQDAAFDAIDRALGLDWMALLAWMNDAPVLYAMLRPIYSSLTLQMTLAVLCLAYTGRLLWLRAYTLAFMLAALITIAISGVLPAAGVWLHYGLTEADSPRVLPVVSTVWPVFTGLRDGSMRALVAVGAEGVITFPSLHAALAVIMIAALWPIAVLRWVILTVNTIMLAATPIDGAHYFIDVFAGVAVAALSMAWAHAIVTRASASSSFGIAERIVQSQLDRSKSAIGA
jgi:hypothetical protein